MAQTYLKKINKAAAAECRNRRKVRLMILIITVAAALFEASEFTVKNYDSDDINWILFPNYDNFFGLFLMFVAAAFGAFAVYGVFSDLTNKQTADVQLSLPMSAKDRFLSKILAVAKLHLIPLACASLFVLMIGCVKGHAVIGDTFSFLFKIHCIVLAEALFVDSICIFCMCCCGAKAEGVYTSMITAFCVTLTPTLVYNFITNNFSSVSFSEDISNRFLAMFGGMIALSIESGYDFSSVESWVYLGINMAASCLLVFASFFIYRKRDGRQVGRPMVYDLFMELFMFAGLFTLFTMFSYAESWGIGLTLALIIYLVIRIVAARAKITPKTFLIWLLKYVACFGIFLVIMAAGYFTGGFGHYKLRMKEFKWDNADMQISTTQYANGSYLQQNRHSFHDNYYVSGKADYPYNDDTVFLSGYHGNEIKKSELDDKLEKLNKLIDEYYTLENRSTEAFLDMMFGGVYKNEAVPSDNVNVYISLSDDNTISNNIDFGDRRDYNVSFIIPPDKLNDFLKDAQDILSDETDDVNDRIYEDVGSY
ncbi:hypothetical protein [Ruminococcus albus]|uniref:ABC-type transport system involved in multi-copper enzyme maturation, permease component n=1 Tax=Ruminococcus albus TaxID=1264 RepID=A0A1H7K4U9_RUMAL|nr:hypothetical protein [Ruminococcus albus]SEK81888.1 ABC-type transport system involved in multi-copper enzyme maturation, permease component [Ruminococcus albus]